MPSSTMESSTSSNKEVVPQASHTLTDGGSDKFAQIQALRQGIDHIDDSIAMALIERYLLSQKVQKLKNELSQNSYTPAREHQILSRLKILYPEIPQTTLENIYREVFDWMRPKL